MSTVPPRETGKQRASRIRLDYYSSAIKTVPPQETGKQRASRIRLDYYKRPNFLERWKNWLAAAALVVPIVWLGTGLLRSDSGRLAYSPGPVAAVHATWENNCTACHTPFTPIAGTTWATSLLGQGHTSDQRCQTCHAGPPHHRNQTPELACAACHHDHRGRDASLVRLADADCTQCHSNLAGHLKEGNPKYENVTSFGANHPEFRVLRDPDPGKLKFNHQLHLSPGMAPPDKGDPQWTLAKIPAPDRERYRQAGQKDDEPVRLDCASCHQVDSGDLKGKSDQASALPVAALLPARSAGAYMLPVTYENHCRACHPLTLPLQSGDQRDAPLVTVPHGLQPADVRTFLWGAAANQKEKQLAELQPERRPLPGKDRSAAAKKARAEVDQKVDKELKELLYERERRRAGKVLFLGKQTCGECHHYEGTDGDAPKKIQPTAVRSVWFDHAVFNHTAHRRVECLACHEQAKNSVDSVDVLLPGIENCRQCHRSESAGHGGARSNCTECHRYHNGDASQQGVGARARDPRERVPLERFLSGK
jgi:hypothetical protein